jgi:hypothetical protein
MENYTKPGNNLPAKPTEKKVEALTKAKEIKPNLITRSINVIIGPEGLPGIVKNVGVTYIAPTLRDTGKDIISNTIRTVVDTLLYGEVRSNTSRNPYSAQRSYGTATRPNQPFYSNGNRDYSKPQAPQRARSHFNSSSFIIPDRAEAMMVLEELDNLITDYGVATVADFYDLIGVESEYTDHHWGWYATDGVTIRPVSGGGFTVVMSQPKEIQE